MASNSAVKVQRGLPVVHVFVTTLNTEPQRCLWSLSSTTVRTSLLFANRLHLFLRDLKIW